MRACRLQPLFLLFTTTALLAACRRDDPEPPAPPASTGSVRLAFSFVNNGSPFTIDQLVQDGAGHAVRFDKLKFYVSGVHLLDDANDTVGTFPASVMLVDAAASANGVLLGTISPGHVHEVHFALGLDSATNHSDPTQAEPPLDLQEMHWGWNPSAGYKFLNMEGRVDGNGDGDLSDPEDKTFVYHTATDALLTNDQINVHADVVAGADVTVAATVDVSVLLSGSDLLAVPLPPMGGGAINLQLMASLAAAISSQ